MQKTVRRLSLSLGRMLVQMSVVAALLWLLYRLDSLWLSLLWLLLISLASAWMVVSRTRLVRQRLFLPVAAATFITVLVGSLSLTPLISHLSPLISHPSPLTPHFIPIACVFLAQLLITNIRGLSAFYEHLKADILSYETRLANGQPHWRSLLPFVRVALQAILQPASSSLALTGLIVPPLLTAGLLLGGVPPLAAIALTAILVIVGILLSVASLLLILVFADRRTFDRRGRLLFLVGFLALVSCRNAPAVTDAQEESVAQTSFYDGKAAQGTKSSSQGTTASVTSKKFTAYELPAALSDRPEQIIRRTGYTVSYNRDTRNANWVAWHLTKAHTYGRNQRAQEKFTEDTDVPSPRATDQDYYSSRYDRGHLCPAGDNKWDAQAMSQSFLFTNVCPQNHGLNKYEWNDLEILCRDWARRYGVVDIVCGPVYDRPASQQKTIGRHKVWVPDRLFKVVLRRSPQPKAIAFIYRNVGEKQPMEHAVCTVNEVERITGIDFFPALDDVTEQRIEAEAKLSDW